MERREPENFAAEMRWLRPLAAELAGDASAAEDLVQDAWLALARRKGAIEHRGPFLAGLLRRLAWRWKRGEERRRARERVAARHESLPSAEELALRLETQELLLAALRRLREPLRSTVMLRCSDELSAAEIARRQGIPAATVRARLARGLAELRAELDRGTGGERDWRLALAPWIAGRKVAAGAALAGGIVMKGIAVTGLAVALAALAFLVSRSGERELAPVEVAREADAGALALHAAEPADEHAGAREALLDGAVSRERATPAGAAAAETAPRTSVELRALDVARRPIAGARVKSYVRAESGGWQVNATSETDAEGRARVESDAYRLDLNLGRYEHLVDGELPGPYVHVDVEAPGFVRQSLFREVGAGATTFVGDVLLEPAAELAGSVIDSAGVPVPGAIVEAVPDSVIPDGESTGRLRDGVKEHTRSGADGRFVLAGVALGETVVRARAELRPWTNSAPLALRQGDRVSDLVLVLEDEEPQRWIQGRVVDARGEPVTSGEILFGPAEKGRYRGDRTNIGTDGRFQLGPLEPGRHRLRRPAWDGFAQAVTEVEAGTLDLVWKLEDTRWLAVRVMDVAGAPVAGARVELAAARDVVVLPTHDGATSFRPLEGETAADGALQIELPPLPFKIEVEAAGFRGARAGPFDPGLVASELELRLERGPAVRGCVLADGAPVAGARVELRRLVRGDRVLLPPQWNGSGEPFELRSRSASSGSAFARTDAAGRFTLPIDPVRAERKSDRWIVRAEHGSSASAVVGPFRIDPDAGVDELVLQLTQGGGIAGEILLAASVEAAGSTVCIADEHGEIHTATLGKEGRFEFDRLHPGAWRASWFPPGERYAHDAQIPTARVRRTPDFIVVEGRTSACILDARECAPCFLEGRFAVEGETRGAWTARVFRIEGWQRPFVASPADGMPSFAAAPALQLRYLDEDDRRFSGNILSEAAASLDPDDRFELALDELGEHWLVLANDDGNLGGLVLVEPIDLEAGRNTWEAQLAIAAVKGVSAPPDSASSTAPALFHRVPGPGRRYIEVAIPCEPDGRFGPIQVAAGAGTIYPARSDEHFGAVADLDAPLRHLELAAGELLELDLR